MLPYPWRVSLAVARAALGVCALALYVLAWRPISWGLLPLVAFIVYAGFALRWSVDTGGHPLVTLAVDTGAFILWVAATAGHFPATPVWVWLTLAAYLFVTTFAAINHDWPKVLAVVGLCLITIFVVPAAPLPALAPVMIWCAILTAVWVVNHRYLDLRLSRASKHSVAYRFEAQQAREEERQRIAADFHDGPLQSFIGLQMRLEILKKMLERNPSTALDEMRQLQELCRSQVGELRTFVRSMHPADTEGSTLGASISRMVEQFQKDTGISTSFLSRDYLDPRETETSLELLQIVREGLNNVQKHSRATRVAVALNKNGEALEISIDDNGAGFPFSGSYNLDELDRLRLGPVSIRRRVRALGGELNVDSRPGQGSGLKVRVALT